ncbi:hypothetical protein [Pseudomonas coronafaciens]|uniref:hypothetical protein n=1 Tax=Pseudomonas coronafaciens TaxID=53409 RepID=UPI0005A4D077|nr:hypothetical protein [Pseudomonas coronafaciens]KGS16296.1 hypothetical protein OA77_01115 [Pseudomonas coronafaciens]RMV02286.1 hypothetical protein ALP20_00795 [Pseudomonas coronafaciens pv. coronafaciens]
MRLFDWLRPRNTVTPSALAELLESGKHFSLDEKQTFVEAAVAEYPEAQRIADSLRDFPEDWAWSHKGYTLQHVPSGFKLWVANEDWGLAEDHGGGYRTAFSKPEQQIIWPTVQAWLTRGKLGFTGRVPKVRIHRENGVWWCFAKGHPWAGAGNSPAEAYESWARAVSIQERKDKNPDKPLQVWSRAL